MLMSSPQDLINMSSLQLAERALKMYPELDPARLPNTPGPFPPRGAAGVGTAISGLPGPAGADPGMNPGQLALMGSQMLGDPKKTQPFFPQMGHYGGAALARPMAPPMQMSQAPGRSLGQLIRG